MICAVIPARGGSQRIPLKNIQPFHGIPIIAYSILLAQRTAMRPIVTTDSEEIAAVARRYGAEVYWRSPGMERDEVGTQEVVREVFTDKSNGDIFGCVLYATAPLITDDEIYMCHRLLYENPIMAYVYTVDADLNDTGGFYFGYVDDFVEGTPLEGNSYLLRSDDIDINTPDDWERAEKLYEERNA